MEEPPEILAEGALDHLVPAPELERVGEFLDAAARAGKVEAGKKPGTWKKGRRTLKPARFLEDFAGTSLEIADFRRLLRDLAGGEPVCRARVAPRVDAAAAAEALGAAAKPAPVKALVGFFEINARYYAEKQIAAAFVVDLASGAVREDLEPSLAHLAGAAAEPWPKKAVDSKAFDRALEALRRAAHEHADGIYKLVKNEVAQARADRRAAMEGYFEGLEEEYMKEERRMYYHLYYFDQQEKLAAKRQADLEERQKLVAGQERYYQVETAVRLEGLALLELPVWKAKRGLLCGLSGRTL